MVVNIVAAGRTSILTSAILALALFISACGQASPEEQISAVASDYSAAVSAQDWQRVCQLISKESVASVLKESGRPDCPTAYADLPEAGQETLQRSAQGAEFISAEIDGQRATAQMRTAAGTAQVPMIEEDGQWRVYLLRD